jgi:hypothetical protein
MANYSHTNLAPHLKKPEPQLFEPCLLKSPDYLPIKSPAYLPSIRLTTFHPSPEDLTENRIKA